MDVLCTSLTAEGQDQNERFSTCDNPWKCHVCRRCHPNDLVLAGSLGVRGKMESPMPCVENNATASMGTRAAQSDRASIDSEIAVLCRAQCDLAAAAKCPSKALATVPHSTAMWCTSRRYLKLQRPALVGHGLGCAR